jgi:chromosomal replication initiation ATPase DnaA
MADLLAEVAACAEQEAGAADHANAAPGTIEALDRLATALARRAQLLRAQDQLQRPTARKARFSPEIATITDAAARCAGLKVAHLVGTGRVTSVVRARRVAMSIAHERGFSYSEIGRALQRDHSTVMASVRALAHPRGHAATLRQRTVAELDAADAIGRGA